MAGYRLTVRHGSRVRRDAYDDLDAAVAAMERRAEEIRAEGPLEAVTGFRRHEPGQRVHARLELSTGGFLRSSDAGVDVMGDGSLIPFAGSVRRRPLETANGESPFDAVRAALS